MYKDPTQLCSLLWRHVFDGLLRCAASHACFTVRMSRNMGVVPSKMPNSRLLICSKPKRFVKAPRLLLCIHHNPDTACTIELFKRGARHVQNQLAPTLDRPMRHPPPFGSAGASGERRALDRACGDRDKRHNAALVGDDVCSAQFLLLVLSGEGLDKPTEALIPT